MLTEMIELCIASQRKEVVDSLLTLEALFSSLCSNVFSGEFKFLS
jgi:hypothetical protein